jgi:hypothetical protein
MTGKRSCIGQAVKQFLIAGQDFFIRGFHRRGLVGSFEELVESLVQFIAESTCHGHDPNGIELGIAIRWPVSGTNF